LEEFGWGSAQNRNSYWICRKHKYSCGNSKIGKGLLAVFRKGIPNIQVCNQLIYFAHTQRTQESLLPFYGWSNSLLKGQLCGDAGGWSEVGTHLDCR
jgi:hypothetical protein